MTAVEMVIADSKEVKTAETQVEVSRKVMRGMHEKD